MVSQFVSKLQKIFLSACKPNLFSINALQLLLAAFSIRISDRFIRVFDSLMIMLLPNHYNCERPLL